ncbi:MAG: exodeoxyribonuclease VII small subunit [Chloroflexi bacterium]|nr:exodeoxyribonuclease VII small subunit [Chloroflexota bacterium]
MSGDELTFEQAFARLQELVAELEAEQISLEESLALYEQGMRLLQHCSTLLDGAELRVRQILPGPPGISGNVETDFPLDVENK